VVLQVGGLAARRTHFVNKNVCCELPISENHMQNLAESSKEGYVTKRAVLPVMMMAYG
jgi:hypothetical protein